MRTPIITEEDKKREPLAFPTMGEEDLEIAMEYGCKETLEPGQSVFEPGDRPLDFYVVLSGAVDIVDTSGDQERLVTTHGAGHFIGDVNVFTGRPA